MPDAAFWLLPPDWRNGTHELQKDGGFCGDQAISAGTGREVNRSRQVHPGDLQGLKAFQSDDPEATVALLHRGREPLPIS
jgi:hypothetical protein